MNNQAIEAITRRWVEEIVVGMNLCPFAHVPFQEDNISYRVSRARESEAVYRDLLQALDAFLQADPARESTGLFICPYALGEFAAYNDFLGAVEQALAEADLESMVQVASFHPDYRFADAPADDPAHFTNRSPFPMFHFIRQDALSEALESYPDPQTIPERNMSLLRGLGWEAMAQHLERILQHKC